MGGGARYGDNGLCRVSVITHHSSGGGGLGMGMVVSVGFVLKHIIVVVGCGARHGDGGLCSVCVITS